jgi:polysaccharide export outer membrane protein
VAGPLDVLPVGLTKELEFAMNVSSRKFGLGLALCSALAVGGADVRAQDAATPATPAATPATSSTAPVVAPAGATDSTGKVDASTYVIGSEDGLTVTVWQNPQFSGSFPVRPDGKISLTLLGDVQAAGLTPMQLSDNITQRLKTLIKEPFVSVAVTAINSQRIFMIGEIGKVGPLTLTAGMTPLQAIASAGGLSTFANSKRIYILRGEAGKQQKIPFNYKQALKGDSKQLIPLKPGDTIVVP